MQGLAEFGLQQGTAASPTELLRLMTLIQPEASRMGRLVEDLLLLAKFDTDRPLDRRHVDLASIAAQAVQAARIVNPDRPITLLDGDPVIVYADTERAAAGHRQPDRQRRPAHPAALRGHRVRDRYHRTRGGHRRG